VTHWFTFHRITFTLIKYKIKSHSFFYFFFFLLLTFDGGGGFCNYFDSWKIEEGRIFSLTPLTLFFLSLSLTLSHSYSLSHKLIYLFYTLTLSLHVVINSIELIWTSPFQKYSLNLSHSAQVMSHISHSCLTFACDWVDVPHDLGFFFVPFFDHIMSVQMITSEAVSEWVRINYWALAGLY
jgi:hypothetical protein